MLDIVKIIIGSLHQQADCYSIDPTTNMWTRKTLKYESNISVDIKRDEKDIRKYMTRE